MFTAIHASLNEERRKVSWEVLNKIVERMNKPWMVVGDFNDIASITRRKKGAQVSIKKCNVFRNRINDCNLIAIGTIGPKYTWR